MEFLGHVSKEGSRVDPTKIQEVRGWTQPTSPNLILELYAVDQLLHKIYLEVLCYCSLIE